MSERSNLYQWRRRLMEDAPWSEWITSAATGASADALDASGADVVTLRWDDYECEYRHLPPKPPTPAESEEV
jgi:hypothetical protein